jgi:branched-chain amino acid transport system permease protein
MSTFMQQLLNGLTIGSVYALIALGYTMVYGIIELINFAHGEIYMMGAYMGVLVMGVFTLWGVTAQSLFLALALTFLAAMVISGAYGVTIERIAYRPLRAAHRLSPLISALGMSIFLQNYIMLAQGVRDQVFPVTFIQVAFSVGEVSVSVVQLAIILISCLLMVGLHFFIQRTKLGKAMRATAQDRTMASLVGINIDRVISATFLIGSALAAAAGVMVAMYYGVINFSLGAMAGLKAFIAAVLGGIGNIPGAMVGGMVLGVAETFCGGYISSEYKDLFAFAILIVVLIFRPSGILGEAVPEKY